MSITVRSILKCLAVTLFYMSGPVSARPAPHELIDIRKNPGCGVTGLSAEEKIARNKRLGQLYFQGYVEGQKEQYLFNWFHHDCMADDWMLVAGSQNPMAEEGLRHRMTFFEQLDGTAQAVMRGIWRKYPDFSARPGSLKIFAWEGGATWYFLFEGHGPDGKHITMWEKDTILVNDAGEITRFEYWNDTVSVNEVGRVAFGKELHGMPHSDYKAIVESVRRAEEDCK